MAAAGRARGLRVLVKSADSGGEHCCVGFSHCPWEPHDLRKSPVLSYICSLFPHLPGGGNSRMRTVAWWELPSAWNSAWQ